MSTKAELLDRVALDAERRETNVRGIERHYDSVLAPLLSKTLYLWADMYEINISISGTPDDLTEVFRVMRANQFVPDSRPEAGKSEFTTRFRHQDGTVIYFGFTSTVCRRVQTGTVMVETPVYETVCGDDPVNAVVEPEMEGAL